MSLPISEIVKGAILWESCQQGNMRFEATSDPWREDGPGGVDRWHIRIRNMAGEELEMCSTGDAYGPHIYTEPMYVWNGPYTECPACHEQTGVRIQPEGSALARFAKFYCQSCKRTWSSQKGND